ncbi:MAG: hypothetical protein ABFE01_08830 [Phycisphaerales bacterium]
MEKWIRGTCVTVLLLDLVLAFASSAQNSETLQYHSVKGLSEATGDLGSQYVSSSPVKPKEGKLPEFKSNHPLFFAWKTPMVPAGEIWIALDKTGSNGGYDRMYLDANANGDLTDDPVYAPSERDGDTARFGPVKLSFEGPDGAILYELSVEQNVWSAVAAYFCQVRSLCWREGPVRVGDVWKHCRIIDQNGNGAFNDKSANYSQSDRIQIGEQTGSEGGAVGNFVEVDNKLYKIEIARDGSHVSLAEAGDVSYGTARLAGNVTTIIVSSENGSFLRKPENGVIRLPAGAYHVDSWTIARKEDSGSQWEMKGVVPQDSGGFTLPAGGEVSLPFGEPIYSRVKVTKQASVYVFEQTLEGRQGERIVQTVNGQKPAPPKLRIRSQDGNLDTVLTSAYG